MEGPNDDVNLVVLDAFFRHFPRYKRKYPRGKLIWLKEAYECDTTVSSFNLELLRASGWKNRSDDILDIERLDE